MNAAPWTAQDWVGLIAALGSFVGVVGTLALQFLTLMRGKVRAGVVDEKLDQLTHSVNGQAEKLNVAIGASAYSDGRAAGVEQERSDERERERHG